MQIRVWSYQMLLVAIKRGHILEDKRGKHGHEMM